MEMPVHYFCVLWLHIVSYNRMSSGIVSYIGVQDWKCLISLRLCRSGTGSCELTYMAPISASAAEDMIVFMICAMMSTSTLLGGKETSLDMKKFPPARLLALDSLRQIRRFGLPKPCLILHR